MYFFSLTHVPSTYLVEAGFMTHTAASHQGSNKMIWLHFGSCHVFYLYIAPMKEAAMQPCCPHTMSTAFGWGLQTHCPKVTVHQHLEHGKMRRVHCPHFRMTPLIVFLGKSCVWLSKTLDSFWLLSSSRVKRDVFWMKAGEARRRNIRQLSAVK